MRVYVTGASGFLGKHVVRALEARGHEITRHEPYDCFVHLAARCGGIGRNVAEPYDMLADNIENDSHLVACAIGRPFPSPLTFKQCPHFIGIGSVCMYPASASLPLREEDIWNGYPEPTNGPYGIAKRVQLELLRTAHAQYDLPYTFLVLANLYGPGDHFDREDAHVIPMLVKRAVEAKEKGEPLTVWGDGTPTRDFLYVEDAAQAIVAAVEAGPQNEAINVGLGQDVSILQVAAKIAEILHDLDWQFDESKPNGQQNRVLSVGRLRERLGWCATTGIALGLQKTVQWYLDNRKVPVLSS